MKLFPLLLIGLAPYAVLQEPESAAPPRPLVGEAVAKLDAIVREASQEPTAKPAIQDPELQAAAEKAQAEAQALQKAADAKAAQAKAVQDEAAAIQNEANAIQAEADAINEVADEAAAASELLDVREVDPREFASGIAVEGVDQEPSSGVDPAEAALRVPLDAPETTEGMYLIDEDPTPEVFVEVAGRSHAPIGVPLTLQVSTGQFGIVLRGKQNRYDGLRDSRENLSSADAFAGGYSVAPTERTDDLIELEALYGLDERWDLYAVIPYSAHELDYDTSLAGSADLETNGLGDIQLGGIFRSYDVEGTRISYLAGLSLPTGETGERGNYAGVGDTKLPYDMQLGSGTFDLLPGILWESSRGEVLLGARAAGRIHLETENDDGWFRSNSMRIDLWAGTELADALTGTLRVQGDWWGDLHNFDPELDPTRSPGEDSLRQGGSRVNLYGGLSWDLDDERTNQIALEVGAPVEEWLDGPQLSQEFSLLLGWRAAF